MSSSMSAPPDENQFLLSTLPPSRAQNRLAVGVLLLLLVALLVTVPFAPIPTANSEVFLPAYAAALLVNELITATLLLALFSVQRSLALFVLSIGYLFSGLMVAPWALTFPGVFGPTGLLEAGLQSTASIAALRRVGFPLFVLGYALLKNGSPTAREPRQPAHVVILWSVVTVALIVCGLSWLIVASDDLLPRWMINTRQVSAAWPYVPASASALCVAGLVLLWIRRRSVLDLWLMIVLCSSLIEIFLLAFLSAGGRFTVGWWAGRAYGLASASVVLLVLLSETTRLYARLARSVLAERRAREARLASMEALSAAIAHEVNQPLASMVTNADAGLRWLDKKSPDLEEARAALKRIVNDGHRAGKVIDSVRAMFKKGAQERVSLNINELIQDVLRRTQSDAQLDRVAVQTELGDALPLVAGNPVQLQQVMSNLIANSIDAMSSVNDRARVLRVRSELDGSSSILVSVEDSGIGLTPDSKDRIFEPFFTTKAHGMGMGLMFCRSIVEAHGGQIRVADNLPQGTVVQFTLPGEDSGGLPATRAAR